MDRVTIDSQRLNSNLVSLGNIGEGPGGMQRVAFSEADIEGRSYIMRLMMQAGLNVRVDAIGNIIAKREGRNPEAPAIAMGSHVDTVPNGGKYDGALGVIAAIEAIDTLNANNIVTNRPIEILVFINEEGTRFHRALYGSRAVAGLWEPEDYNAVDEYGMTAGEHLRSIDANIDDVGKAIRYAGELHAYLELHIEQGPELSDNGVPIGVVSGITGRSVYTARIEGFSNHAGTTPMEGRRDALLAASKFTLAVNSIATEEEMCRVGTVGTLSLKPGAFNVIPGEVELSVDFRDIDLSRLKGAYERLAATASQIADATDTRIDIVPLEFAEPWHVESGIQEIISKSADMLGMKSRSVVSGAGHDAQAMGHITKSGMLFVPSVGGISHSPDEFTYPHDCGNGAEVLLNTLLLLDDE